MSWIPPPDGSRDRSTDDPTNVWLVHLAGRMLLPLALRLRLSANSLSVAGFVLGAAAALAYTHWADRRLATLGFVLCVAWLIADGLDGMVARATATTSGIGRFLDGLCDHSVFLLLYVALADSIGTAEAWALALSAGAAHAVQATLYEGERVRFHRRIRGDPGGRRPPPSLYLPVRLYDHVASSLDRAAEPFDRLLARARDPHRLAETYRRRATPLFRLMIPLTNNMRVLSIYLACLAGDPRWFWWLELGFLSAIALAGMVWHRRVERALAREWKA